MSSTLGPHQPRYAKIDASTATIAAVAAVSGKKIRVLQWVVGNTGAAAATGKFRTGTSADLMGAVTFVNDVAPTNSGFNPEGHFETVASEALNFTQSGTEPFGGYVVYTLV